MPTQGPEAYEDDAVFDAPRRPDSTALTVVNRLEAERPFFLKAQCMHCDHPACASSCIVGAFTKEESGAVVWDTSKCIGCRYCIVACPFQVPAFEWGKALEPRIMKCDFCAPRQRDGELPACVERCPVEALTFGPRDELLRVAHERIKRSPGKYNPRVYGELEVGGTSWMYLSARELAGEALPKLGTRPAPGVSESIQHGIFAYFVPPVALYSLLGFLMWDAKNGPREGGE
ncbi:4Fe-4S dicluster domain-containing protein [bacterium]|nr:MAG: 4Fe-4S dicluster domain-containing protein [bacterium]